jgi:hypothetical protein
MIWKDARRRRQAPHPRTPTGKEAMLPDGSESQPCYYRVLVG